MAHSIHPAMQLHCIDGVDENDLPDAQRRIYVLFRCVYNRHPALANVLHSEIAVDATGCPIPPRFDPGMGSLLVEAPCHQRHAIFVIVACGLGETRW